MVLISKVAERSSGIQLQPAPSRYCPTAAGSFPGAFAFPVRTASRASKAVSVRPKSAIFLGAREPCSGQGASRDTTTSPATGPLPKPASVTMGPSPTSTPARWAAAVKRARSNAEPPDNDTEGGIKGPEHGPSTTVTAAADSAAETPAPAPGGAPAVAGFDLP